MNRSLKQPAIDVTVSYFVIPVIIPWNVCSQQSLHIRHDYYMKYGVDPSNFNLVLLTPCYGTANKLNYKPSEIQIRQDSKRIYRVSQEECAKLRESVPYVKLYRYNPKHLYPKLNGYGDNGKRSLKL